MAGLDDLLKPIRDFFISMGMDPNAEPVDTTASEDEIADNIYNEIARIMREIPDDFYRASGGYSGMSKQEFLNRANELRNTCHNVGGPAVHGYMAKLHEMHNFAWKLYNKWLDAKKRGATATGSGGTGTGSSGDGTSTGGTGTGGGDTTPIAEDQKPPETTNYMTYGFIALIAVLVIVVIIVLRRK